MLRRKMLETRWQSKAFTLIELLVVIAIIGVLVSLLLPAIQKAREAAARAQCANNCKQMGLALHNYADQHRGRTPTSGEGVLPPLPAAGQKYVTTFDTQSFFTQILPYVEQGDVYAQFDLSTDYNSPTNVASGVAKNVVPTYLCPSNPIRPSSGKDSLGYGYVDYMTISYVDINGAGTGKLRDNTAPNKVPGALRQLKWGSSLTSITDGLSKTIFMGEDVGRSETFYTLKYPGNYSTDLLPAGNTQYRNAWRWAEPDSGNGVSGAPAYNLGEYTPAPAGTNVQPDGALWADNPKVINNSPLPFGGPAWCPWTNNNCGVNDELFSFHGPGANVVFCDGHVTFLDENIDAMVLRRLCTPNEGQPIQDVNGVSYADY